MSSETDQPRQRTVAELLAAHGGQAAASGRRRRRREADETTDEPRSDGPPDPPVVAAPPAQRVPVAGPPAGPREPRIAGPRPPALRPAGAQPPGTQAPGTQPPGAQPPGTPPAGTPPPSVALPPAASRPANGAAPAGPRGPAAPPRGSTGSGRENPTDVLPRLREPQPVDDVAPPGRLSRRDRSDAPPVDDDGGPSTMVGLAPAGAEDWHAARTGPRRGAPPVDGGPPPAGRVALDDGPAGLGGGTDLREQEDDGYDDDHEPDDEPGAPRERERRLGRSARETVSTAWSTVLVQWLAGALGGAVLWVAFRFLWRSLPVVAVAAALAVTVGLVLVVRALLHNDDRRTTVFAVLVGLLLTVSPAILVVLGR